MTAHTHNHEATTNKNSKLLLLSLFITIGFMAVEVTAGIVSGSLTLLADASHMFTDGLAIFLSWFAITISRKPKDNHRTYGYHRFQVIATFLNGISLLTVTLWIIHEALYRIYAPGPINGAILFYVGLAGLIINLLLFIILRQGDVEDMNIKSALIHVFSDLLGSLGAAVAGAVIIFTGKVIADPLLSLFVSLLLLKATFRLISESGHILMEGAPRNLDIDAIKNEIKNSVREIQEIHHLHIWSLKATQSYITFHITLSATGNSQEILKKAKEVLLNKFGIEHSTIQTEYEECVDREC